MMNINKNYKKKMSSRGSHYGLVQSYMVVWKNTVNESDTI